MIISNWFSFVFHEKGLVIAVLINEKKVYTNAQFKSEIWFLNKRETDE